MKNARNFRLALYGGLFVVASAMFAACGESETKTETTDTVATETPAPVIDTAAAPAIDTAAIDTGRAIIDPKKPE